MKAERVCSSELFRHEKVKKISVNDLTSDGKFSSLKLLISTGKVECEWNGTHILQFTCFPECTM